MSTVVSNYGNVVVLSVKDDLVGDNVAAFSQKSARAVETGGCNVVVDCSAVSGFDSAGLEALVDLQEKCEEGGGGVKLCGLDQTCTKTLEITRLDRRFELFDTLESAVRSFA